MQYLFGLLMLKRVKGLFSKNTDSNIKNQIIEIKGELDEQNVLDIFGQLYYHQSTSNDPNEHPKQSDPIAIPKKQEHIHIHKSEEVKKIIDRNPPLTPEAIAEEEYIKQEIRNSMDYKEDNCEIKQMYTVSAASTHASSKLESSTPFYDSDELASENSDLTD